uniref:Uncharacterized protein n=1 Tax=viral metagenome TaxID=1070528 RepID=A0A6M3M1U1_9ZZZZ
MEKRELKLQITRWRENKLKEEKLNKNSLPSVCSICSSHLSEEEKKNRIFRSSPPRTEREYREYRERRNNPDLIFVNSTTCPYVCYFEKNKEENDGRI